MKCCYTFSIMLTLAWLWCSLFISTCVKYRKFPGIIFYLDPKKLSSPATRLSWSIKMLKLQGRRQKANNTPAACSHGVSWINSEGSAGWREECQRCWQLGHCYRSLWSTAAYPYCRLLAPHLHSYAAVFAHSRQVHYITCVDLFCFVPVQQVKTRVAVWCQQWYFLLKLHTCVNFERLFIKNCVLCNSTLLDCEVIGW